jgi:hypothetical protein
MSECGLKEGGRAKSEIGRERERERERERGREGGRRKREGGRVGGREGGKGGLPVSSSLYKDFVPIHEGGTLMNYLPNTITLGSRVSL